MLGAPALISSSIWRVDSFATLFFLLHLPLTSRCFSLSRNSPLTPPRSSSFSTPAAFVQSIILDQNNEDNSKQQRDFTTLPAETLLLSSDENVNDIPTIIYSSNLLPKHSLSTTAYLSTTKSQHLDCLALFGDNDAYSTSIIQCRTIDSTNLNLQWRVEWIPNTSSWLYNLANVMKWEIQKRALPYDEITSFSWRNVFQVFQKAFETKQITLPVVRVEGNSLLTCDWVENTNEEECDDTKSTAEKWGYCKSIKENIALINEADSERLLNRRVAQELAAWLDVSRRPFPTSPPPPSFEDNKNKEWWSALIQQRILATVPGAGPLDIDPNEDDKEGIVAVISFGFICIVSLALSYDFLVEETQWYNGGVKNILDAGLCEEVDLGFGYYSDCL